MLGTVGTRHFAVPCVRRRCLVLGQVGWSIPLPALADVAITCSHHAAFNRIPLTQILPAVLASPGGEVSPGLLSGCLSRSHFIPLVIAQTGDQNCVEISL